MPFKHRILQPYSGPERFGEFLVGVDAAEAWECFAFRRSVGAEIKCTVIEPLAQDNGAGHG